MLDTEVVKEAMGNMLEGMRDKARKAVQVQVPSALKARNASLHDLKPQSES